MNKLILTTFCLPFLIAVQNANATSILFSEDFNNANSLDDWTITTGGLVTQTWNVQDNHYGTQVIDGTPFLNIYDWSGQVTNEIIETPTIPAGSGAALVISYEYSFYYQSSSVFVYTEVFDGTTWQVVKTYSGSSLYIQTESIDVTSYANANFKIRFRFENNVGNNWEHSIRIDNVVVTGDIPTSVSNATSKAYNVYPNPASSLIKLEGVVLNSAVEIKDISGKVLYYQVYSGAPIDIGSFPNGIYFVNIQGDVRKIVKN